MRLTLAGEYAIRAMLFLADQPTDRRVQISEIAETGSIPENFLRNIVLKLAKNQLIQTHRGAGGGVKLLRPASEVTLLDVIEAVEGKLSLNHCLVQAQEFCGRTEWCSVHLIWSVAQSKMIEELTATSLAELVIANKQRFAETVCYRSK